MNWVKLIGTASLALRRTWAVPTDYWGQVDVWVPQATLDAFVAAGIDVTGNLFSVPNADAVGLLYNGTDWFLTNDLGGATSFPTPFTANTTHTIKFHINGSVITWYLDGVSIGSAAISFVSLGGFVLGPIFFGGSLCCASFFATNVRAGSSDGGTDFLDCDFSDGFATGPNTGWTATTFPPSLALLLPDPFDASCPTLTVSPTRGQPGDTVHLAGAGYTPGAPLSLFIGNDWVSSFDVAADGGGNFTATLPIPPGVAPSNAVTNEWTVTVCDTSGLCGCFQYLHVCGAHPSDGFRTDVNPQLATGGVPNNPVLDYIFHDGAHWVLWQDPSVFDAQTGAAMPPPTNHTLNATRISADGTSVTDFPIDTGYDFNIAQPPNALGFLHDTGTCCCPPCGDCGSPVDCADPIHCNAPGGTTKHCILWDRVWWFESWMKPVLDARFASDGSTLWVGVLTREMVGDPWSNQIQFPIEGQDPAGFLASRPAHNPGNAYDPTTITSTGLLDFCHKTAFPVTDGGIADTGNWDPPRVRMFSLPPGGGGFTTIGTMDAEFCPGSHTDPDTCAIGGVTQVAQRGTFFSGISLAASPNQPGVCHLVWSEGGDWGTFGEACFDDCGCPGNYVWDAGPLNRDYRVGYSVWTPTAKAAEYDLFHSHIDRQLAPECGLGVGWNFPYDTFTNGYTWPPMEFFAAATVHSVVNDTGTPILFISFLNTAQNPNGIPDSGGPWLDYGVLCSEATVRMYDIAGGTATALQHITPDLIPTEAEADFYYAGLTEGGRPPYAPNAVNGPVASTEIGESTGTTIGTIDRYIGVSLVYEDPLLGGDPVYLVRVPWVQALTAAESGTGAAQVEFPLQAFYRVPADGSAPFDFLDGTRQVDFTIVQDSFTFGGITAKWFGGRFFSDPRDIWIPSPAVATGFSGTIFWGTAIGEVFDRICLNQWTPFNQGVLDAPPFTFDPAPQAACPGFYYDPDADTIYYCSLRPSLDPDLFQVTVAPICRECLNCNCGLGVHIAHRF